MAQWLNYDSVIIMAQWLNYDSVTQLWLSDLIMTQWLNYDSIVTQWVSRAQPHQTLPAFLNLEIYLFSSNLKILQQNTTLMEQLAKVSLREFFMVRELDNIF